MNEITIPLTVEKIDKNILIEEFKKVNHESKRITKY